MRRGRRAQCGALNTVEGGGWSLPRQSAPISGNRSSSAAIGANQWQSELISATHRRRRRPPRLLPSLGVGRLLGRLVRLMEGAISGNQWQSEAIRGNWRRPPAWPPRPPDGRRNQWQSVAIGGNQRQLA